MLEGIEILVQSEIMQTPLWAKIIIAFTILGLLIFFIGLVESMDSAIIIGSIVSFFCLFGCLAIILIEPEEPTGIYEYQVIIDDNVSFTELYEKYEIVDQNGEIWTIRDKE